MAAKALTENIRHPKGVKKTSGGICARHLGRARRDTSWCQSETAESSEEKSKLVFKFTCTKVLRGRPLACFSVHSNTHVDTHIKLAHFKEGERAGGGGAKATPLDSICSAEFNMSGAGGALFFPAGLFPGDTSISGRWLGRQRETGPTAQPHGVLKPTHTHTERSHTHTDINSCQHTHGPAHRCVYSHKSGPQTENALSDNNYRLGQTVGGCGGGVGWGAG